MVAARGDKTSSRRSLFQVACDAWRVQLPNVCNWERSESSGPNVQLQYLSESRNLSISQKHWCEHWWAMRRGKYSVSLLEPSQLHKLPLGIAFLMKTPWCTWGNTEGETHARVAWMEVDEVSHIGYNMSQWHGAKNKGCPFSRRKGRRDGYRVPATSLEMHNYNLCSADWSL